MGVLWIFVSMASLYFLSFVARLLFPVIYDRLRQKQKEVRIWAHQK